MGGGGVLGPPPPSPFGGPPNSIKRDINSDIVDLGQNQQHLTDRVIKMHKNVDENTKYISSMKTQNEIELQTVSTHIQDIEVGLASDIETLKLNIEDKFSERNDILNDMKDQLSAIKAEYEADRDTNRGEFKKLYDDYALLKQAFDPHMSDPEQTTLKQPPHNPRVGYDSRERAKERVEKMKNLVVDGVFENPNEDLAHIIGHMCHDIHAPIAPHEVIEAKRIGSYDAKRRWPRPVRVTFDTESTRMRIYENRNSLPNTRLFGNVRMSPDEPKDTRVKRAKLRQAVEKAKNAGKTVLTTSRPGEILIDGKAYNMTNTDEIPEEFRAKPGECKLHNSNNTPANSCTTHTNDHTFTSTNPTTDQENIYRKPFRTAYRRLKDGNTRIDMVGPCLQKTKRGLAFISGKCFLSNFFKCPVKYNGHEYPSSEHCWQAQKAYICKDPIAMAEIKSVKEPLEAKRIGERIIENEHWKRIKVEKMADILQHKFRQNKDLYFKLINTRPYNLIEASLDGFWGAYCRLYSEVLIAGTWTGQNILGRLLVDLRTDLIREEETKRLHTPSPPTRKGRMHSNNAESFHSHIPIHTSPMLVDSIQTSQNSTRL